MRQWMGTDIISSGNGMCLAGHQAITRSNAELPILPVGTTLRGGLILNETNAWKMSAKWQPTYRGLDIFTHRDGDSHRSAASQCCCIKGLHLEKVFIYKLKPRKTITISNKSVLVYYCLSEKYHSLPNIHWRKCCCEILMQMLWTKRLNYSISFSKNKLCNSMVWTSFYRGDKA